MANISDKSISIKIVADTAQLKADLQVTKSELTTLQATAKKSGDAFKSSFEGAQEGIKLYNEIIKTADDETKKLEERQKALRDAIKGTDGSTKEGANQLKLLTRELAAADKGLSDMARTSASAQKEVDKLTKSAEELAHTKPKVEPVVDVAGGIEKVKKLKDSFTDLPTVAKEKARETANNIIEPLTGLKLPEPKVSPKVDESAVGNVTQTIGAKAVAWGNLISTGVMKGFELLADGVKHVADGFLEVDKAVGTAKTSLSVVFQGGAEEANKYVESLKETPATFNKMVEASQKLGPVLGKSSEELRTLAASTVDLTGQFGATTDEFDRFTLALSQATGAGKLQTEDFNQMRDASGGAAIALKEMIIQQSNGVITQENWSKSMANGLISTDMLTTAVNSLGKGYEGAGTHVTSFSGLFDQLSTSFDHLSYQAVEEGLKGLGISLDDVAKSAQGAMDGAFKALPGVLKSVGSEFSLLGGLVSPLIDQIAGLADQFSQGGTQADVLASASKDLSTFIDGLHATIKGVISVLASFVQGLRDSGVASEIATKFEQLQQALRPIGDSILPPLQKLFENLAHLLGVVVGGAISTFISAATRIASELQPVADFLGGLINIIADVVGWFDKLISGANKASSASASAGHAGASVGRALPDGTTMQDGNVMIEQRKLNESFMTAITALQQGYNQPQVNITGSLMDAKAIAVELRRIGVLH